MIEEDVKVECLGDLFNSELPSEAKRVIFYELCQSLGLKFEKKVLAKIEKSFQPESISEIKQAQLRICPHCLFHIQGVEELYERCDSPDGRKIRKEFEKHLKTCPWLELLTVYSDAE